MTSRLANRAVVELSGGGVKVWSEVIALAKIPGVTDLGQGWPDVPSSEIARKTAISIIADESAAGKKKNQYSPINGLPELRKGISTFMSKRYNMKAPDPDKEIVVTTSGTEAIFCAVQALCNPGDEVIIFEPFFPWYLPCVRLAGAVAKVVTLEPPNFEISPQKLEEAFSDKTKLVILNSPHNPTGHVVTESEIAHVATLCQKYDALALFDEVYETIVFDGAKHRRLSQHPGMEDRTINVGSAGKIFNLTGWRIGWISGPADLIAGCNALHGYTSFSAPTMLQQGIAEALVHEDESFYVNIAKQFGDNFQMLSKAITTMGHTVCCVDGDVGGYFLVADISKSGMSAMDFCKWLATEKGVACVPLSVFYTPKEDGAPVCQLVRFAICKQKATLEEACKKLTA